MGDDRRTLARYELEQETEWGRSFRAPRRGTRQTSEGIDQPKDSLAVQQAIGRPRPHGIPRALARCRNGRGRVDEAPCR
jgi:hypothetical protein